MKHIPIIALLLSAPLCGFAAAATDVAPVVVAPAVAPAELALGEARATYKDGVLKIATGVAGRTWSWTGAGLSTNSFT